MKKGHGIDPHGAIHVSRTAANEARVNSIARKSDTVLARPAHAFAENPSALARSFERFDGFLLGAALYDHGETDAEVERPTHLGLTDGAALLDVLEDRGSCVGREIELRSEPFR